MTTLFTHRHYAMHRLTLYLKLTRFDKPIGILLLLWPTLSAIWLASDGHPNWSLVLIFTLGTALMRAAGCAVNDIADRHFDKHVKRTAQRVITNGQVTVKEALWVAIVLSLLAFSLIYSFNPLTKLLSIAALGVAASYPYFKRFFALPQAYLGIAFGFGIPMAYAAILNYVPVVAWLLLVANIFWALAYDTEYAMVDREDDLLIGIRTSAITFGRFDVLAIMLCYIGNLLIISWAGWYYGLGHWFFAGMLAASCCVIYHYFLIRKRDRAGCFSAFRHNNWLGMMVFLGIALDFAFRI